MFLLLVITLFSSSLLNVFTAVEISVNPAEIVLGLTKRLQVHCSMKREDNSTLAIINSIAIFHSSKVTQPKYVYQASVNSLDGKVNGAMFNTSTASGVINNKGESFLQMTWEKPSKVRAGVYKCEASGVNGKGTNLTVTDTAIVRSIKSRVVKKTKSSTNIRKQIQQIEKKLKELQEKCETQDAFRKNMTAFVDQTEAKLQSIHQGSEVHQSSNVNQSSEVQQSSDVQDSFRKNMSIYAYRTDAKLNALQDSFEEQDSINKNMNKFLDQMNTKLTALQQSSEDFDSFRKNMLSYVDQTKTKLDTLQQSSDLQALLIKTTSRLLMQTLFYVTPINDGRRYLLSRQATVFSQSGAQEICKMFGGYLVEIDTKAEFDYLRQYLTLINVPEFVLTGGSDEKHEGYWINTNSGTPIKEFNWAPNYPVGGRVKNCQCFWKFGNWYMTDCDCSVHNNLNEISYMCEIQVYRSDVPI